MNIDINAIDLQLPSSSSTKSSLRKAQRANRKSHPFCWIDRHPRKEGVEPVGYCWSSVHRGFLDEKALRKHQCLRKQCESLQKYVHPYWRWRDDKKFNRKINELLFNMEMKQQFVNSLNRN